METRKLIKKVFITGNMNLITGLRVGDSKENVEIGGVDAPVVRRKDNNQPYIPGSSIKGKIRCLLELVKGENPDSNAKQTGSDICKLFGAADAGDNRPGNPSRLIVRDAYMNAVSADKLRDSEFTDMPYTEVKAENSIDRIKGNANNPRSFERIPAGTDFDVNFIIDIFEGDEESTLIDLFKSGIKLLESDCLGGSGSRGYGQVKLNLKFESKSVEEIIA